MPLIQVKYASPQHDKSEDLAGAGCWQTMKLEGVGSIAMSDLLREALGEVNDLDGFERAALYTHAAPDAERLTDEANSRGRENLDAYLACFVHGTCLLALLLAFLWLALIRVDNGNSEFVFCARFHIR